MVVFLVSWNVAGWFATSSAIRHSFRSLGEYFDRIGAHIVCIQECKGSWKRLEDNPREMGVGDDMANWEAFWSFSKNLRSFNGVVTFVRKGLTVKCDSRPFTDDALNDEGRVVVTYHSAFTLVNVYVVNARNGAQSAHKKYFLDALLSLLERLRSETRLPTILAGDLNMTYLPEDAHWSFRRLDLAKLERIAEAVDCPRISDEAWSQLHPNFPRPVCRRMVNLVVAYSEDRQRELDAGSSVNSPTGSRSIACDTGIAALPACGRHEPADGFRLERDSPCKLADAKGAAKNSTFTRLLSAGLGTVYAESLLRPTPGNHSEVFMLVKACGLQPHEEESRDFMGRLLESMVDSARITSEPAGERVVAPFPCPFTCWDQSKNKRQTNEGTRIDYILVDKALKASIVPRCATANNTGGAGQVAPGSSAGDPGDFFSEFSGHDRQSGIRRAMGGGLYDIAPTDGSGLPPLSHVARLVQFEGLPSTGLFVTPPQFSDHIGVCTLFDETVSLQPRVGKLIEVTRCMYKPPGRDIRAFFAPRCAAPSDEGADEQRPAKVVRTEATQTTHARVSSAAGSEVIEID